MHKPGVGVGTIIIKDGKLLIGKRKNAHGAGTWCFPGGHLEHGETWATCAERETKEETGIEITNIRYAAVTNDIFDKEQKHYITIFMIADYSSGEPKVLEPEKAEEWGWFPWDSLPEPLFLSIRNLKKTGYDPCR